MKNAFINPGYVLSAITQYNDLAYSEIRKERSPKTDKHTPVINAKKCKPVTLRSGEPF